HDARLERAGAAVERQPRALRAPADRDLGPLRVLPILVLPVVKSQDSRRNTRCCVPPSMGHALVKDIRRPPPPSAGTQRWVLLRFEKGGLGSKGQEIGLTADRGVRKCAYSSLSDTISGQGARTRGKDLGGDRHGCLGTASPLRGKRTQEGARSAKEGGG